MVHQQFDLDEAAEKIDSSKKTLDDYLLNLRFAIKFEFDFHKHQNESVGFLRSFVHEKRQEIKDAANIKWLSSKKSNQLACAAAVE